MDASSPQGRATPLTSEGIKTVMYHVEEDAKCSLSLSGRVDTNKGSFQGTR